VTSAVKTTAAPAANSNNRRHLVSSLLPKRRPLNPTPETKDSEVAEPHDSEGKILYDTVLSLFTISNSQCVQDKHTKQTYSSQSPKQCVLVILQTLLQYCVTLYSEK